MPQLMPLNWVFSSAMILMILMMISFMYSENINLWNIKKSKDSFVNKTNSWYW